MNSMSILFYKIILSFLLPVAFAQSGGQWDLLNLFEQFKLTKPDIIRAYQLAKAPEAWAGIENRRPGLNLVTIGIPDTGIDSLHPEFDNVVLFSDSLDLAGVLRGGHGTQVAGIIGANNISFGGTYTAPQMNGFLSGARNLNYKLIGKRVLNLRFGQFERFLLSVDKVSHFAALDELMKSNPDIVNMSFGGIYNNPELFENDKKIYEKFFNDHPNTLFIAGAGNDSIEVSKFLPAAIELNNIITTGATSLDDKRASFSNFGSTVSISAPGVGIYAPAPRGKGNFPADTKDYDNSFGGTSASAPMVTGVAGLIKAIKPELTPAQIKQILVETGDPIQTDKPIGPRLNAEKAVCHPLVLKCVPPQTVILQPGPGEGKDIWTTSIFSYAPGGGGPGGGRDDEELVVGGWGDLYYSLLEFNLNGMPARASTARLELFPFTQRGIGTTGIYLDRITEFWDWRTQGTGRDRQRLWWADRPAAVQWIPGALPEPTLGQWYSIDITDLYNAWQNGTYSNDGVQLRPVFNDNRWSEFYSSDYLGDPTLRPRLIVVPASGGAAQSKTRPSRASPVTGGQSEPVIPALTSTATSTSSR